MSVAGGQPNIAQHWGARAHSARLLRRVWTFLRENDLSGLDGVQF